MDYKVTINKDGMTGEVTLALLPFLERSSKAKDACFHLVNGELVERPAIEQYEKCCEIAQKQIKAVALSINGVEINSVDELVCYNEFKIVLEEIVKIVINGPSISKK